MITTSGRLVGAESWGNQRGSQRGGEWSGEWGGQGGGHWGWEGDGAGQVGDDRVVREGLGHDRSRGGDGHGGGSDWGRGGIGQWCGHWGGDWSWSGDSHWGRGGHWSSHWGGDDGGLVDQSGRWVLRLDARLIGLDGGAEAGGVGHVVDDSGAAVDVTQTVASGLAGNASGLASEGAAAWVVLVVAEGVVADRVLRAVLAAGAGRDGGRDGGWGDQMAGRGDCDEAGEADEDLLHACLLLSLISHAVQVG